MNRESFYSALKSSDILTCYLFEGEEEYTKESALRALRSAVLKDDPTGLNATVLTDPDADTLIACAETLPMMADRRFVLVKECSLLQVSKSQDGEEKASSKSGSGDRIAEYISDLPGTVCLVFYVKGKANASRKLYKGIAKLEGVVSFEPLDQTMMIKWIAKELKSFGKQIDRRTAEQIMFAVGQDMHRLANELAKLAAYAGDHDAVTMEDIDAICTKSTEYRVFDLSDAMVKGNAAAASRLMADMLREGEQRLMLLSLLQRQYRQLLFIKILSNERMSPDMMSKHLSLSPFVVRKLQPLAQNYPVDELLWAQNLLTDTEFFVKSGQIPEEGSLEQAVYRLLAKRMKEQVS